ncbi:MAG TPA: hypothetical protein VKW77_08015, partial [Acidimicrobiales bacterium]|nr:hypothetical protein [Acidimicrobiales bacterium]
MIPPPATAPISRRELLSRVGTGVGLLGLAGVFAADVRAGVGNPLAPKAPHFPGKARRLVHLFMNGGPS